jgi:hypothetical protein
MKNEEIQKLHCTDNFLNSLKIFKDMREDKKNQKMIFRNKREDIFFF